MKLISRPPGVWYTLRHTLGTGLACLLLAFGLQSTPLLADHSDFTYGNAQVFDTHQTSHMATAALDAERFIIAYADNEDQKGKLALATLSGHIAVSTQTPIVFNPSPTSYIAMTVLDANRVLIAFRNNNNFGRGQAMVATISGPTITLGQVHNVAVNATGIGATKSGDDHVVISYSHEGNNGAGTAIAGKVTGTSISFGAPTIFQTHTVKDTVAASQGDQHVVVGYRNGETNYAGTAVVAQRTGKTLTFGTPQNFSGGSVSDIQILAMTNTHMLLSYLGLTHTIRAATRSGTALTLGVQDQFSTGNITSLASTRLDDTHFTLAFADGNNGGKGTLLQGLAVNNTLSFGEASVFENTAVTGLSVVALDAAHACIAYANADQNHQGQVTAGTLAVVLTPPEDLQAEASDSQVTLTWKKTVFPDLLQAYRVYRSTDPDSGFSLVYEGFGDEGLTTEIRTGCVDTGLTNGTTYYYKVCIISTDNEESPKSTAVSATPQGVPPTAVIDAADPVTGTAPLGVTFTTSAMDNGTVVLYEWDFNGDGVFDYSATDSGDTGYTYTEPGTYAATFRVKDDTGLYGTTQTTITVAAPPAVPTAGFTATPVEGVAPLEVTFTDTSEVAGEALIDAWTYDFDADGQIDFGSSTSGNTTHVFTQSGTYTVKLTITTSEGVSDSATAVIVVHPAPNPPSVTGSFTMEPFEEPHCDHQEEDNDDQADDKGKKWKGKWKPKGFLKKILTHLAKKKSKHKTKHQCKHNKRVRLGGNWKKRYTGFKKFFPKHFKKGYKGKTKDNNDEETFCNPGGPKLPIVVTFNAEVAAGSEDIAFYRWDIDGDGNFDYESDTTPLVEHTYTQAGTYTVVLEVEDVFGQTGQDTLSVEVLQPETMKVFIKNPVDGTKVYGKCVSVQAQVTPATLLDRLYFEYSLDNGATWKSQEPRNPKSESGIFVAHFNVIELKKDMSGTTFLVRAVGIEKESEFKVLAKAVTLEVAAKAKKLTIVKNKKGYNYFKKACSLKKKLHVALDNGVEVKIGANGLGRKKDSCTVHVQQKDNPNPKVKPIFRKWKKSRNFKNFEVFLSTTGDTKDVVEVNGGVELAFPYDDEDQDGVVDGTDTKEKDLVVFYYSVKGKRWVRLTGIRVDCKANKIYGTTYHFTTFGVFGPSGAASEQGTGTVTAAVSSVAASSTGAAAVAGGSSGSSSGSVGCFMTGKKSQKGLGFLILFALLMVISKTVLGHKSQPVRQRKRK